MTPALYHADSPAPSPDARAGAVLRAAGHAVQRIPPDQGARRAGPSRRPRHLSHRPRRRAAEPAHLPRPAAALACGEVRIGPSVTKVAPRRADARHHRAPGAGRRLRRGALARGDGPGRRLGGAAGSAIPHLYDMHSSLPQQLEQLQVQPARACCAGVFDWRGATGWWAARTSSSPSARSCRTPSPRWASATARSSSRTSWAATSTIAPTLDRGRDPPALGHRPPMRRSCSTPAPSRRIRDSTC